MQVVKRDGTPEAYDEAKIRRMYDWASRGLAINVEALMDQTRTLAYDNMTTQEIYKSQISAASGLISIEHPEFTFVAARLLLAETIKEVVGEPKYPDFVTTLQKLVDANVLNPQLLDGRFDMAVLAETINPDNDLIFDYVGMQTLVDRYLLRDASKRIVELPQHFLMRVAMGLSLLEDNPTERAIDFYALLSSTDGMTSTPTLFNSGTRHSQLSSCYLNIVADQISADVEAGEHRFASIYGTVEECARLSKFAGGIGTSWTRVRGQGSNIASTNGRSSGVIPYLKVYNDTAVAVNQGGKRKGSFASYLEPWHPDFWDFCEIKKEFGDERLRAHDIFPAAWVPDLFMERVREDGVWSEFCPHTYPELHDLWGDAFTARYTELEAAGKAVKQRRAKEVWRRILTNLFETGHPWITFKDECNRRSPQKHAGVVHSSNLCTEITLNTSDTETAVCNLASVNLARHVVAGRVDFVKLEKTVTTLMRMLDNVIDLNYYPSDRAETSNKRHRPVGLGIMGETEAKVACGIAFDSDEGVDFSDMVMEHISYFAIKASAHLARERGVYPSFVGSDWSQGILPIDTARDKSSKLGEALWDELRQFAKGGMRNSNTMAIAPTATISVICGTTPCNEPIFEVSRIEENMSGHFMVVDPCVKYRRPDLLRTVWEMAQSWIIKTAARRQKWIDQAQSVNIFVGANTTGKALADIYVMAWEEGLKTTYYLRSRSDTKEERKATPIGASSIPSQPEIPQGSAEPITGEETATKFCSIDNPSCEACQ